MTTHPKSRRLPSGVYSDLCAVDCGSAAGVCTCAQAKVTVQHLAHLVCLHCSRPIMTVELTDPRQPIRIASALRCSVCSGPPTLDVLEERRIVPKLPCQLARVGRPPAWLKALRKSA